MDENERKLFQFENAIATLENVMDIMDAVGKSSHLRGGSAISVFNAMDVLIENELMHRDMDGKFILIKGLGESGDSEACSNFFNSISNEYDLYKKATMK